VPAITGTEHTKQMHTSIARIPTNREPVLLIFTVPSSTFYH
jgi:hypothetical protein